MKTSHTTLAASLALVAVAALTGCATNVNSVERAQPLAETNYISDKRVVTDNTLARTVRVVSVNQSTVSGNLLKIQATLENLKSNPRTILYKFEWVDQGGMALSSPTDSWKSLTIQGRDSVTVSSVATSPRAADFSLKLMEQK